MPDTSERCARCGSVREDGRWVRRARPASGPGWTPPAAPPPADLTDRSVTGAAPPAPAPGRTGRGCLVGALVLAVIVVLVGAGALLAVARSGGGGTEGPRPTWSSAYAGTFEGACRATGADADYCRCLRGELEARIPEQDMARDQRRLAAGRSLDPGDARTFREAEARCGH